MDVTIVAARCRWYLHALGRNPLIRLSDRVEAASLVAVLVMALYAIQLAAQFGASAYHTQMHNVEVQARDRHPVTAQVIEGTTSVSADFDNPSYVRVQWPEGSHLRTEQIVSAALVESGATMTIWLDDRGRVVPQPLTASEAKTTSIAVEWTVWVTTVVFSAIGAVGIRVWLDRCRRRAWERELELLVDSDDGWANRHP